MQVKLESLESKQSIENNKKKIIFKPIFDMIEQKIDPLIVFWTLAVTYFGMLLAFFKKISWMQMKLESV